MSGGYFEYQEHRINDIADGIEHVIKRNSDKSLDEWGQTVGRNYSSATIRKLKSTVKTLRKAAKMAHEVDYLLSGDYGEDCFLKAWKKLVTPKRRR